MNAPGHVVLVTNFPPDRQESMRRFADVLVRELSGRGWRVTEWRPEPRFVRLLPSYRYGGLPKYLGYLDKFLVFPRALQARSRRTPGAVFHITDHSNAVYASALAGSPLLVTCHDLLPIRSALGEFPQVQLSRSGRRYQQWILRSLSALSRAVCVSAKTRDDLARLTGLPDAAMPVVYMGLNHPYRPMPRAEAVELFSARLRRTAGDRTPPDPTRPFLLGIGGAQWYKNRTGLLRIFAELQKYPAAARTLIYIGPEFDSEQKAVIESNGLGARVLRLTGVSNEELRAAYSLAQGLLFPSWEEGFGWPIAEAQACGCPVFTSNRAPMTEVGGSAARYVDPGDAVSAAAAIAAALPNAPLMAAEGLALAARWSTTRMIEEYEQQYASLAQDPARLAAVEV